MKFPFLPLGKGEWREAPWGFNLILSPFIANQGQIKSPPPHCGDPFFNARRGEGRIIRFDSHPLAAGRRSPSGRGTKDLYLPLSPT
jgi:hypothetical protein